MSIEFQEFPKIARLSREVIITEKIDGTNGCIYFTEDGTMLVGSRTRWITPANDNHGFAKWAYDHEEELRTGLGAGRHFGEWWGSGIQRGYGLPKSEKRFSLFDTIRWCRHDEEPQRIETQDSRVEKFQQQLPECCDLVPVLWNGTFNTEFIESCLQVLQSYGSHAAPGYLQPEGIVVYHIAGNVMFKKTLGNDGHKGTK